ncbi:alpha/beta hydrolase [Hylemonella gracilis]|uniref:Serine aminopeptidase S33 domain-containing protein n=1 Tax=Hylemonella gracilis ATCC 19624 TaxID=887062 RepID=F3KUI2_9BURK|nr:hypothetical protein HGR_10580 [Hylemonella gracilis ATCC 19624]
MQSVETLEFEVAYRHTVVVGDRWTPPRATRTAMLLHGGGSSTAEGFRELRTFLYVQGIETVSFDFVGHGRTGGQQSGTTLEERVQQALQVVSSQQLSPSTLTLIGFSMGAYIAAKTTAEMPVSRLCLAIPAAYSAQAYKVPFGPQFSHILRTPRSWADSDAFELIHHYTGHLLVVSAEKDNVVPPEIAQRYSCGGTDRASTVHHVVRHSGHHLIDHCAREPHARIELYSEIATLCQRDDG